jgi:hypothetical protein
LLDAKGLPLNFELIDAENNYWANLAVFHPITDYKSGRPRWMLNAGNNAVLVLIGNIEIDFPFLIMAFKAGEDINTAVPIDLIEVVNDSLAANMVLALGNIILWLQIKKAKHISID